MTYNVFSGTLNPTHSLVVQRVQRCPDGMLVRCGLSSVWRRSIGSMIGGRCVLDGLTATSSDLMRDGELSVAMILGALCLDAEPRRTYLTILDCRNKPLNHLTVPRRNFTIKHLQVSLACRFPCCDVLLFCSPT